MASLEFRASIFLKTEMELAAEITHVTNEINEVNAKINAIEVLLKKRY